MGDAVPVPVELAGAPVQEDEPGQVDRSGRVEERRRLHADGMQHLLARAVWDHDAVRDNVRCHVVKHLGDQQATLVIDESGDLKKGTTTVGVQRQYTGTAGRIENAQVGVYLVYASDTGHAIIDRELYLPRSWTDDAERCRAAGIPDRVGFATKPELARAMLCRALDAGVPASWVTCDEVYGASSRLRGELQGPRGGYVLAVACHHPMRSGGTTHRAGEQLAKVPARAWQCVSAGPGAKGHRLYDWAFVRLDHDGPAPADQAGRHCSWSAATAPPASWPSTTVTPRPSALAVLVRSRAGAGGWKRASRPARGRRRRDRAHPPPTTARAGPGHLQRGQPPVRHPGRPAGRAIAPSAALVLVAATT